MSEPLLPCPFCGGDADISTTDHEPGNEGGLVVECGRCSACSAVVIGVKADPLPRLVSLWNHRTPPASEESEG